MAPRSQGSWRRHAVFLFCSIIAALCQLETPQLESPGNGVVNVPLIDFTIVLSFKETVQVGEGDILLSTPSASHTVRIPCPLARAWASYAAVPVTSPLGNGSVHTISAPNACFRNNKGLSMTRPMDGLQFTTIDSGRTLMAYDIHVPLLVPPATSTSLMPHSPLNRAWVKEGESFILYFKELVKAGASKVFVRTMIPMMLDSTVPLDPDGAQVIFDEHLPGKVTIVPPPAASGFSRELSWQSGAFVDRAGNAVPSSDSADIFGLLPYRIFVTTRLLATSTNLATGSSNIVLNFQDPVAAAGGSFLLCAAASAGRPCELATADVAVALRQAHFVGKTVIINPPAALAAGQWTLSLADAIIEHFDIRGVSSSIIVPDIVDTLSPQMVAKAVDCNGNGVLDSCGAFLDAISDTSASTPLQTAATFLLYFSEAVAISPGRNALLEGPDGKEEVALSVGIFDKDCVVTIRPALLSGRLYTLKVDAGVIVDTSAYSNPYKGTSFTFFTPLGSPTILPRDGAVNVPTDSVIGMAFPDEAKLELKHQAALEILDHSTNFIRLVLMEDANQVVLGESEILVLVSPPLDPGRKYTVTIPVNSLRFQEQAYSFSFTTQPKDSTQPSVVSTYPDPGSIFTHMDSILPYVVFSKAVAKAKSGYVSLLEDGKEKLAFRHDCAAGTPPCFRIDLLGRRISFLVDSNLSVPIGSWAKPGSQLTFMIPEGSFDDSVTAGARPNPSKQASFSFAVDAAVEGPKLLSAEPVQAMGSETSVFLTFNELVKPGPGVEELAVLAQPFTGLRPPRILRSLAFGGGQNSTLLFLFDSAVQAGLGTLGLFSSGTMVWQADAVTVVGPLMLLQPPPGLLQLGMPYELQEVTPNAVKSAFGVGADAPVGAQVAASFLPSGPSMPQFMWSTLDEHACLKANGILPDVRIFMDQSIMNAGESRNASLHHCPPGGVCGLLWNISLEPELPAQRLPMEFQLPFTTLLQQQGLEGSAGQPLKQGAVYELRLSPGLVESAASGISSPGAVMVFSICAVRFDMPRNSLLRVYSGLPFAVSSTDGGGPRRFEVKAPRSVVQTEIGNKAELALSYSFLHDYAAPTLDSQGSLPLADAGAGSNIILKFNEVVKAGEGELQIWDLADTAGPKFTFNITALALGQDGYSLMLGRVVCLSPPSPFTAGATYYVKANKPGVLLDAVGNPLNKLDTSASFVHDPTGHRSSTPYSFTVTLSDQAGPDIAFVASYEVQGTVVTGYVVFTESVAKNIGQMSFEECGADYDCDNSFDNPLPVLGAATTFGTRGGSPTSGVMKFVVNLPLANRKYRVTIPPFFVRDVDSGRANPGPSRKYSFFVNVGTVPPVSSDRSPPAVQYKTPINGATQVAKGSPIRLYFDEEVQAGTGTLRLCSTGQVAGTEADPQCAQDAELLAVNVANGEVEWRALTIRLPEGISAGQQVYVLVPKGAILDRSPLRNPIAAIQGSAYTFRVADEDVQPPKIHYVKEPRLLSEDVWLQFDEAVNYFGGLQLEDVVQRAPVAATVDCLGSLVRIQAVWELGGAYKLTFPVDAFRDMVGQRMEPSEYSLLDFNITEDNTAPIATSPLSGEVQPNDVFVITFNEDMLRGSGLPVIGSRYERCPPEGCADWTLDMGMEGESLPVFSFVNNSRRISAVFVQPESPMQRGWNYSLRMPSTALLDTSDNNFTSFRNFGEHNVHVGFVQDWEKYLPRVALVVAGEMPDPRFTLGEITIYFSESMQPGAGGAQLAPSNGGSNCESPFSGVCPHRALCNQPCSYAPALKSTFLLDKEINGSRIVLTIPTLRGGDSALEPGRGYKVVVPAGAYLDLAGNPNAAFDGEIEMGAVLQSFRSFDLEGPIHVATEPLHGETDVAPSTLIKVSFNEIVQAGTGVIRVGPVEMKASSCHFAANNMTCRPPAGLAADTTYSVTYDASAVIDLMSNPLARVLDGSANQLIFKTADIDLTVPRLVSAEAVARGAGGVTSSTVILLTFSEPVQAGSGLLGVVDCSMPDVCDGGASHGSLTGSAHVVDVQSNAAKSQLFFNGNTVVYVPGTFLRANQKYAVSTSASGVFRDAAGLPLMWVRSSFEFYVIPEDQTAPFLEYSEPAPGSQGNSPTLGISLYFSEPVLPVRSAGAVITVSDGQTSAVFRSDNSEAYIGSVKVLGSVVLLDPVAEMSHNATVSVTIAQGAFADLRGNPQTAANFTFKTSIPQLKRVRAHKQADGYSARERMMLQNIGDEFLMYGGTDEYGCLSDMYSSTDGATWSSVLPSTAHPAMGQGIASPASAVDGQGCLWLLGGQCSKANTSRMWRSCTKGVTWQLFEDPEVMPDYDRPAGKWPVSLESHSLAVVSGWQIVLVDGPRGHVWRSLDVNFESVVQASNNPPFGRRAGSTLLGALDGRVYLLGGHPCTAWPCQPGEPLGDVWVSSDAGSTWHALAARYSSQGVPGWPQMYTSAAITLGGAIVVLDRRAPPAPPAPPAAEEGEAGNTPAPPVSEPEVSGPWALVSRMQQTPFTLSSIPLLLSPPSGYFNAPLLPNLQIMFSDAVRVDSAAGEITLVERTTGRHVAVRATTDRQTLSVTPKESLLPGRLYKVNVPDSVVTDVAGVPLSGLFGNQAYQFTTTYDNILPEITSVYPGPEIEADPWTAILLTFTEAVQAGTGKLLLECFAGRNFSLDVSDATVLDNKVLFEPDGWLSGGQTYTISVPNGLLKDVAGNSMPARAVLSLFKVRSGMESSAADAYSGDLLGINKKPALNDTSRPTSLSLAKDSVPPVLVKTYPPPGATDLPMKGVNFVLFFSENVVVRMTQPITILVEGPPGTRERIDVEVPIDWSSVYLVEKGVWFQLADKLWKHLRNGATFHLRVPSGVLGDPAGNAAAPINLPFRILEAKPDNSPPLLMLSDPPPGARGIVGGARNISLWFSEPIVSSNGTVGIVSEEKVHITVDANSSQTEVRGRQLLVAVTSETFEPAGISLYLQVSAWAVQDLPRVHGGGNPFGGLEGVAYVFTAMAGDHIPPTMFEIQPPSESEASPDFRQPVTVAFRLLFNEQVKAGSADRFVVFKGKFTRSTIQVSAASSEVTIQGSTAIVTPAQELMPGEVYTLEVEPGAFTDLAGNPATSSIRTHIVSTAAKLHFQALPGVQDLSLKSRAWSAAAVDSSNRIFIVGGSDAMQTTGPYMNDVWALETGLGSPCAAGPTPPEAGACGAECFGNPPTLGSETVKVKVWKPPGKRGSPCISADGKPRSRLGDLVSEKIRVCPCPVCSSPPPSPAPPFMVNPGVLAGYTNVTAFNGTVPLQCNDGYFPSDPFTCVVENRYTGKWIKPQCLPGPCAFAPPLLDKQSAEHVDPRCKPGTIEQNPLYHGEACLLTCEAGFAPTSNVTCLYGTFPGIVAEGQAAAPTRCDRMTCERIPVAGGVLDNCTNSTPLLHDTCDVVCQPGHRMVPAKTGRYNSTRRTLCEVASTRAAVRNEMPEFLHVATCRPRSCGPLILADPNGVVLPPIQVTVLGAKQRVGCGEGFIMSLISDTAMVCGPVADINESSVQWQGNLRCIRGSCSKPLDSHGTFFCSGYAYQDLCTLKCKDGYQIRNGDGKYTCTADGYFQGTGACEEMMCPLPDYRQIAHASSLVEGCPQEVGHRGTCQVLCEHGYQPRGVFGCAHGGYAELPICQPPGTSFRMLPFLNGTLRANLTSIRGWVFNSSNGTGTLSWPDRISNASVRAALAVASNTSIAGVVASWRVENESDASPIRRLNATEPAGGDRTGNATSVVVNTTTPPPPELGAELVVSYQIRTTSLGMGPLASDISNPQGFFQRKFVEMFQAANPGVIVGSLELDLPWVVSSYVVVTHPKTEPVHTETNAGFIVGIVLGAVLALALVCALSIGCSKRKKSY